MGSLSDQKPQPDSPVPFGTILWWIVWFGLLGGLGEVAFIGFKKFYQQRPFLLSPYVVWMAPVTNIVLYAIPGLLIGALTWRWSRLSRRLIVFTLTIPAVLGILFMYSSLHRSAALLVAAGMAVQAARLTNQYAAGWHRLVRWTLPLFVLLVLAMTGTVYGMRAFAARQASAHIPASVPGTPNVLLIVLDTVRAQSLSLYGHHRATTPALERFAGGGVRFDAAIAPAPWTLPTHASLFTGHWPHATSADWWQPLDQKLLTLAEFLSGQGYLTAGFVANTVFGSREFGLHRGFVHYEDYRISPGAMFVSTAWGRYLGCQPATRLHCLLRDLTGYYDNFGRKHAAHVNQAFLQWLDQQEHKPFFVFLNYFDAHDPYTPPAPFDTQFGPEKPRQNPMFATGKDWQWTPAEVEAQRDAYERTIAAQDDQIGRLLAALQQRGVLDHTLVIITSDHGEEFYEHQIMTHGSSLYRTLLHVPLVLVWPGRVPAGTVVTAPVTLRDVPATVVDLLGMQARAPFPGQSLSHYWHNPNNVELPAMILSEVSHRREAEPTHPAGKGNMKSLISAQYHYIKNADGREELYDWVQDPWEQHDLAGTPDSAQVLQTFRTALDAMPWPKKRKQS